MTQLVPIAGSERAPLAGAKLVGPVNGDESIKVSVYVRRRMGCDPINPALFDAPPQERQYPSREQLAASRGADPGDLAKVDQFAQDNKLTVVETNPEWRCVVLSGRAADMCSAFGVKLQQYTYRRETFRGREGPVCVPADLAGVIIGVFGLDNRPQASAQTYVAGAHHKAASRPRKAVARVRKAAVRLGKAVTAPHKAAVSFTPHDVAGLYGFPSLHPNGAGALTGKGQCIAILRLGGEVKQADLKTYFAKAGLPVPNITIVGTPMDENKSELIETALDIEVVGSLAPDAKIVLYYAAGPDDQSLVNLINQAVWDSVNKPMIISISWGKPENQWTPAAQTQIEAAFTDAGNLGITTCVASGDWGSGGSPDNSDGKAHVVFPASSPHALACGGTRLQATGSTISSEVVWRALDGGQASGGGISDTFDPPDWQQNANVPASANGDGRKGRGVPDVAGHAAADYQFRVGGKWQPFGGTSVVAPLWAALIARINEGLGAPVGYLNAYMYDQYQQGPGKTAFRSVQSGNNSCDVAIQDKVVVPPFYSATGAGWNACTGLGSPDGENLLTILKTKPGP